MYEELGALPNTVSGEVVFAENRYYAHIGDDDLYEALEIIDTRERDGVDVLRLEPSGDPDPTVEAGMYVAWRRD